MAPRRSALSARATGESRETRARASRGARAGGRAARLALEHGQVVRREVLAERGRGYDERERAVRGAAAELRQIRFHEQAALADRQYLASAAEVNRLQDASASDEPGGGDEGLGRRRRSRPGRGALQAEDGAPVERHDGLHAGRGPGRRVLATAGVVEASAMDGACK